MALAVSLVALSAAGAVGRAHPRRTASCRSRRRVRSVAHGRARGRLGCRGRCGRQRRCEGRGGADRPGRVDRVLYLGDVYEDGTGEDFEENYATVYGRLASVTAPTSGNHDSDNERTGYDAYWRRAHGVPPPDWYAFRAGGWKILSLDSELPRQARSAQRRWLNRQLRAPGTCRIAFWHRPRFSAGTTHGDQDDVAPLWNALRGRAAIALAGHEHGLQRFKPIDGITQFVSSTGARAL